MRPTVVEKPRFRQNKAVMMLDDAEMALELIDLGETSTVSDVCLEPAAPTDYFTSPDFLTELCSAASMIMDAEECRALVREIELAQRNHPVAA